MGAITYKIQYGYLAIIMKKNGCHKKSGISFQCEPGTSNENREPSKCVVGLQLVRKSFTQLLER